MRAGRVVIAVVAAVILTAFAATGPAAGAKEAPWWSKEARGEWWNENDRWTVAEFNRMAPAPLLADGYVYDGRQILETADRRGWVVVRDIARPRVGAIAVWRNAYDGTTRIAILREYNGREIMCDYYDARSQRSASWRQGYGSGFFDDGDYVFAGYIYPERRLLP